MKHLVTFFITIVLFNQVHAQTGFSREFLSTSPFTTAGNSRACLLEAVDSSYFAFYNVGDTASGSDLYVVKMDFDGSTLWEKRLELPTYIEFLLDAVQMPDSTINILCTYDVPSIIYDEEVYFVRIDLDGNIIDTDFITGTGICCWDIADGRLQLSNTNNLLFTHRSFGISFSNGVVEVRNGNNYNYIYGGVDANALYHAKVFQDVSNSYVSFGHESTLGQKRASLVKRNASFTFTWQKYFRHGATAASKMTIADDVIRADSNYVLLMHFEDVDTLNNIYIVKTDINGDSLTSVRLVNESIPFGIYSLGSNGYIVAASTVNNGSSNYMELIQFDTALTIVARQHYRYKNFNEHISSFKLASDGYYLLAGSSDSAFTRNIHVLKVKPDLCIDPAPAFVVNYNTNYGPSQAGIHITNNSDYGIIDSVNAVTTINFGDGPDQVFSGDTLSHLYAAQGTYLITLTITNSCETKSYSEWVTVPCTGQPVAFNSSANLLTLNVAYNHSALSYLWNFGDGGTATTALASHTYAAPGTYYVCLTTTNSCGNITICDSITVVCTPPVIPLPAVVKACIGTNVLLDAANAGSTFQWSGGQQSQQITVTTPGLYTVTVTNVCGVSSVATVDVQLSALPLVNIGADTIMCLNEMAVLANYASVNNYAYQWNINNVLQSLGSAYFFSENSLGLFHVTLIADNNGCLDSASRYITTSPQLFCDTASYCTPTYTTGTAMGDYIKRVNIGSINNITGGTGQPAYMDYTNITATLNAGQSVTVILDFNEVNPMYYRIWIDYNQDGVFTTNEVLTQNAVNPGVSTTFTSISSNAYGGPTRMRVRCASSASSNLDPCISYNYGQTEDYTLLILNGNGAPIAEFDADTTHIVVNGAINFTDESYNNPTSWQWTFTGSATPSSVLQNPTGIVYPTVGCFPVTLKAVNANGMSIKTDTCYIQVDLSQELTEENETGQQFLLQPNPFQQQFNLTYAIDENALAEIHDITGRKIVTVELPKGNTMQTIYLHQLDAGIYYITVKSNQQLLYTNRLVKM